MWNKNLISNRLEEFLGLPKESSTAYQCWHRMVSTELPPPTSTSFNQIYPSDIAPAFTASFAYCAFGFAMLLPNWDDFKWVTIENKTENDRTFLELAAISGSVPTCRYLVEHGVKVNTQTKSNNGSALAAAACRGEREIVEFLIKEGADVNLQLLCGNYGSALAAAAFWGKKEMVEFLVREGGAEVNLQLPCGKFGSALAAAACRGESEIVEFLVREGGAEINLQLQCGQYGSALGAAKGAGNPEIVQLLIEYGAKEERYNVEVLAE